MLLTYFPYFLIGVVICFVFYLVLLYFYVFYIDPDENSKEIMFGKDSIWLVFILSFIWPVSIPCLILSLILVLFTHITLD